MIRTLTFRLKHFRSRTKNHLISGQWRLSITQHHRGYASTRIDAGRPDSNNGVGTLIQNILHSSDEKALGKKKEKLSKSRTKDALTGSHKFNLLT